MTKNHHLKDPWLLAVWPGMGQVALAAGYYLLAKLGMYLQTEFSSRDLFDIEHIDVRGGIIHTGRTPRSRLFVWRDPHGKHDLLLFIGEAQPPQGKYAFCRELIAKAKELGATRVFTFAAMASGMHPQKESRVFGVTTDPPGLSEFQQLEVPLLEDGRIGGLNGILLGIAAEEGMHGTGLLGEIPQLFSQVPFPAASLAVLRVFTTLAGIQLDFTELERQAEALEAQLARLLMEIQQRIASSKAAETAELSEPEEPFTAGNVKELKLSTQDQRRLDELFEQTRQDRSLAYQLKNELDRLGVFKDYEDRFLDLFQE